MRNDQWYEDNKEEILKLYYDGYSHEKICTIMQCGRSKLSKKLQEWKAPSRPRPKTRARHNAIYNIDYTYFDNIDNEHKTYWLGFLLADGHVNEHVIMLRLQKKDLKTIEDFKKDIKSEHPIGCDKHGNPGISIACKIMCDTLAKYGFHHHKSWSFDIDKALEVVPKEYEHHFIRGMFDGDGSIRYYKYEYQKVPFYHFGYTGLKNICDYVSSKLGVDTIIRERDTNVFTVRTKNPYKIIEIYNYLYKDATIYMQRKYDTFQEIIEIEKKRDTFYEGKGQHNNDKRDRCRHITYNNETHSLKEWAEIRDINYETLAGRINNYNWSIGRALEYE